MNKTKLINGTQIADQLSNKISKCVDKLHLIYKQKPSLTIIKIGNDYASNIYVNNKLKRAESLGFIATLHLVDTHITQDALCQTITKINKDDKVHGIIVQSPVPKHINFSTVVEAIDPNKDIDGLHPINIGKLFSLNKINYITGIYGFEILDNILDNISATSATLAAKPLIACTSLGCMHLIKTVTNGTLSGLNVVVIGDSNIVSKPMARLLLNEGCTVSVLHSETKDLSFYTKNADILVSATGAMHLIKPNMIKNKSIIIDVGISRNKETNKIAGDVDPKCIDIAAHISPMPGGVGPMTITSLLLNTLVAFIKSKNSH